jgi:organic radical activating enzyme
MITQACNLSCHGCTNYSDLVHNGYLTWEQGREQIAPWLERVDILDFGILGGEPLMNPKVRDWIVGLRELMPNAQIRFTTNGLLLEKNFDIVELLHSIGNCVFKIAVHKHDAALEETISRVWSMYDWTPVTEFGVDRFTTTNNFRFYVRRPDIFYKMYRNSYASMAPYDNAPAEAFKVCCQQTCPLLYNGRLYKCSTAGLLKDTLDKVGNPNPELWQQFITHGLTADCSDKDLTGFLENFGKPNAICAMCPSNNDLDAKIIHIDNVSIKKVKL